MTINLHEDLDSRPPESGGVVTDTWATAGLLALTVSLAALIIGSLSSFPGLDHRALTLLLSLVLMAGAVAYLLLSRERLLGPIGLFLLAILLWFAVQGIVVFFDPTGFAFDLGGQASQRWEYASAAMALTVLWTGVTVLTYHSRSARWLERTVERIPGIGRSLGSRSVHRALALYAVGSVGRIYRIATGAYIGPLQARTGTHGLAYQPGYDPTGILLGTVLPMIAQIAFVILAVVAARDRRWWLLAAVLCFEFGYGYLTATRGSLLTAGFVVVLAFHFSGRLSSGKLMLVAPAAVIVAFAVVTPYRQLVGALGLVNLEGFEPEVMLEHLRRAWEVGFSEIARDPLYFLDRAVLSRFHGLDSFSGTLQSLSAGHAGYAGGETLLTGLTSSLPRLFFPDRPNLNLGHWFPVNYLGFSRTTDTAIPMPRMVEFYVNFGAAGVLGGAVVMGHLFRWIRGLLTVRSWVALVAYVFLAANFVLWVEKPMAKAFILWKPLLVMALCLWIASKRKSSAEEPGGLGSESSIRLREAAQ